MSILIGIQSLSKSYGTQSLFKEISFTISQNDRIGLIGQNGAGKSSLLKILMGFEKADQGTVTYRKGLRLGYASQSPEFNDEPIEKILLDIAAPGDISEKRIRARELLSKAQFIDFSQNASQLSGGWKKRLDIVRAFMAEPELVLLDEPTNHLDLEGIYWLEKFLQKEKASYLVVSHDRYFLENVGNKILELGRCYPQGIFLSNGGMNAFIDRKKAFLAAQAQEERGLASLVRNEVEWLRRSPAARTTKSQARIDQAIELQEELSDLKKRNQKVRVDLSFTASDRQTRKLLVAKNLQKSLGGKTLFRNLDLTLSPGSRVGLIGKNGSGKTTLLKILAGMLSQDVGTIKCADDLKIVYFDQHREQIPPRATLLEALSPTSDFVEYRGQSIHVHGWAKKFLFSSERLTLPVSALSGGEQARILIARLMLQPADVLFLDEPTNDLDMETLEVMEESLKEFGGAVVLISHDRFWMDRVCTQIISLGHSETPSVYAGYKQWEAAQNLQVSKIEAKPVVSAAKKMGKTRLSYHEEREWGQMEMRILQTENEISVLNQRLAEESDCLTKQDLYRALAEAELKLEKHFERWTFLEQQRN